jgi:hypothetical protein
MDVEEQRSESRLFADRVYEVPLETMALAPIPVK